MKKVAEALGWEMVCAYGFHDHNEGRDFDLRTRDADFWRRFVRYKFAMQHVHEAASRSDFQGLIHRMTRHRKKLKNT